MQIRERRKADLEQLEILARRVHASDRYPIYLPDRDFRRFLTQPPSLKAWVATRDDQIIGHVALNGTTSKPVMDAVAGSRATEPRSTSLASWSTPAPDGPALAVRC